MKKQLLTLATIASLVACDKEELTPIEAFDFGTKVEYNAIHAAESPTVFTIVNHSNSKTEVTQHGDTVHIGLLVEDVTTEYPNIIGSVAYQLIDFKDTTQNPDLIGATINYADGSQEVVEPTSNFELN